MKREIRGKIRELRESLPQDIVREKSKIIWEFLHNEKDYLDADIIMFYSAIDNEVQTDFMIRESLLLGKKVVLPQTTPDKLIPRLISDYPSGLIPAKFGILEPDERFPIVEKEAISLVIVPGVAFSKKCMRLGYGKGYYDRFLKDYKGKKVGISFWEQIVEDLPHDRFDIPLDKIITDKIIINCNKN